ncbi:DegV family protein [Aerococcaceae bacterium WGS1372]
MKPAIIVDSTASINEAVKALDNVFIVDLTVIFEDGSVFEDSSQENEQRNFFDRLKKEEVLPTTSQPSVGQYYETLNTIIEEGYDTVFAVHLSKEISGTYQSATMVLSENSHLIDAYCIDSTAAAVVAEAIVENILQWVDQGKSAQEINELAKWQANRTNIYLMVENLDNLAKGGRLSTTSAMIGNLLKIRPLLYFKDGKIEVFEKIRTNRRVYQRFYELIEESMQEFPDGVEIRFAHSLAQQEVDKLSATIKEKYPDMSIKVNGLSPVIGVHTGVGAIGLAIIPIIKS